MEQTKIGHFIAESRKQQNLTQMDLAEQLGVSDKTISRWETGKSLPDLTCIPDLCAALHINVNELLSGERLSDHNYSIKAEETLMTLMKENEKQKKGGLIQAVLGVLLLLTTFSLMFCTTVNGISGLLQFPFHLLDFYSLLFLLLLCLAAILICGKRSKSDILHLLNQILIPIGAIISIVSFVMVLSLLDLPDGISSIGPNLAVAVLSLLYAICGKVVVVIWIERAG
jgi:DNA-binding XRE family transcriptional regulator